MLINISILIPTQRYWNGNIARAIHVLVQCTCTRNKHLKGSPS